MFIEAWLKKGGGGGVKEIEVGENACVAHQVWSIHAIVPHIYICSMHAHIARESYI